MAPETEQPAAPDTNGHEPAPRPWAIGDPFELPTHPYRVRYTEAGEWLAELRLDRGFTISPRAARVARSVVPIAHTDAARVTLHASAFVRGLPVVLEQYVGELRGNPSTYGPVHRAFAALQSELVAVLRDELRLEVLLGGILEDTLTDAGAPR